VYQIDIGITRLLWVGKERTIESFQGFFGITQSDSMCSVSLTSITNSSSDPSEATAVLTFNFSPGYDGTYAILTQVNFLSGILARGRPSDR